MSNQANNGIQALAEIARYIRGKTSMDDVEQVSGLSRSTISKIERGQKNVSIESYLKLFHLYKISSEAVIAILREGKEPYEVFNISGDEKEQFLAQKKVEFTKQQELNLFGRNLNDIRDFLKKQEINFENTEYGLIVRESEKYDDLIIRPLGFDNNIVFIRENKIQNNPNFLTCGFLETDTQDGVFPMWLLSVERRLVFIPQSKIESFENNMNPLIKEAYWSLKDGENPVIDGCKDLSVLVLSDYEEIYDENNGYEYKINRHLCDDLHSLELNSQKDTYVDLDKRSSIYPKHYQIKLDSYEVLQELVESIFS